MSQEFVAFLVITAIGALFAAWNTRRRKNKYGVTGKAAIRRVKREREQEEPDQDITDEDQEFEDGADGR